MANPEHVKILRQGVEVWNKWRRDKDNWDLKIDLSREDFQGVDLSRVFLHNTNFMGTILSRVNLSEAFLNGSDFHVADLSFANLGEANISRANFSSANLNSANLYKATLYGTTIRASFDGEDFVSSELINANLSNADLSEAEISNSIFANTDMSNAICGFTHLIDMDLSTTKGLDTVVHQGPSTLGVDTLFKSKGKIPEIFLRGCGVPETLITFLPSMYQEAIMFYSCFISYSHDDKEFAKRLHDRLQGVGIRCWLDEHQLKPGDELHKTIYEGIRVYDKVILCCSETSLKSQWVQREFKNALSKEEDFIENVLIPITLDDYLLKQSKDDSTIGLILQRSVGNFSGWRDHDTFEAAFKKVVDALRTDGGKPPPPTPKLTPRK